MLTPPELTLKDFETLTQNMLTELHKVIVGQEGLIHDLLVTLLAGGNALLEGVPGLGKTMLIRTLAEILDSSFSRIQFTPDLMPADIVGTMIITESGGGQRGFRFEKGPVFANLVLADEINRATPRTQSALLEAMQEQRVTIAGQTHTLPRPFFVLATQNPLEMEGTYPLSEAQLDRFLYKIDVHYPSEEELVQIARLTTGAETPHGEKVADSATLVAMQNLVRTVPVADNVLRYAARLVGATRPENPASPDSVRRSLRVGASPRGVQALVWAAKAEALLSKRKAISIEDIQKVAYPALRHRLFLNFEAQAGGIRPDNILSDVLAAVRVP